MFENKYPYTDFHELNLDWFLAEFKKVHNHVDDLDATVHEFTEFVTNYFNNLDVQEEINKKLDVMAADGTLSALIQPLFDEYKTEIDGEIENQNSNLYLQNQKITVIEGRMDAFTTLKEGSTTGDAELMDIRVGADGVTYPTAGEAVRGQVSELSDDAVIRWEGLNHSEIAYCKTFKNKGTATYVWQYDAMDPSVTSFNIMLTNTENVTVSSYILRIQFRYSDSTSENKYLYTVGDVYHFDSNELKTLEHIDFLFYRSDDVVPEVTSEWSVLAYTGSVIDAAYEMSDNAEKELQVLEGMNDVEILFNKIVYTYTTSTSYNIVNAIPVRQDPFYIMFTKSSGTDAGLSHLGRVLITYSDSTNQNYYIDSFNTPVLITPNTAKTVTDIIFTFIRANSSGTGSFATWDLIAWAGNTIAELDSRLDDAEDTIEVLGRTFNKYDRIYQELKHIAPSDDGTSTFVSNNSWGHEVMKTDESGMILQINRDNLIARVYIWMNEPTVGVNYSKLYNWSGVWTSAYIAPNTYFSVVFRNPTQTPGLTIEEVQNNSRFIDADIYIDDYIKNGVQEFQEKIVSDMEDYPVMFGLITDVHYPTGSESYDYLYYRRAIQNGCKSLKEIANRNNCFFIANLGDDAGYSASDASEGNVIQCMTTVDGLLRGGVDIYAVNGNHEAYQNHDYMPAVDFYRARLVNLRNVNIVSGVASNFYFDDNYFKIRFIFFDTETYHREDYTDAIAGADLASMFASAPANYQFILMCHKDIGNASTFPQATSFYTYIGDYIDRLIFQCSGHTHTEGYYNTNGIHDINFMAAGYYNYSGLTETTQWQLSDLECSFTVVGYNPSTKKVKVYGYGMATDRTYDFS